MRHCDPVGRFDSCSRERLVAGIKRFFGPSTREFVVLKTKVKESLQLQTQECLPATSTNDHSFRVLPSFSICGEIGQVFTKWLTGSGGAFKKDRTGRQIATRCFKVLKF